MIDDVIFEESKKPYRWGDEVAENWQPTAAGRDYAISRSMPRDRIKWEVETFVAWHLAHGKSPWPNVEGAWRSWCDRYEPCQAERRAKYERIRRWQQGAWSASATATDCIDPRL
jgi:hypothetical protein